MRRLQDVSAVVSVIAVLASLVAAAPGAGEGSRVVDASQIEPALKVSGPWQRLGDSEYAGVGGRPSQR
jgi:hypothetical protein